jgi:hypothetical protein
MAFAEKSLFGHGINGSKIGLHKILIVMNIIETFFVVTFICAIRIYWWPLILLLSNSQIPNILFCCAICLTIIAVISYIFYIFNKVNTIVILIGFSANKMVLLTVLFWMSIAPIGQ